MDAKAKSVREILYSGNQFLVPFFQRFYSWHRANWERLSADLLTLLEDRSRKQHFLGPLVCAPSSPMPGEILAFQLIDGQQRLTTLSLILAALRDIAHDQHEEELEAEIHETYLIHRFKKGWQQFKLVPRNGDREAFSAIIRRQPLDEFKSLPMVEAFEYFRKSIRQQTHDRLEGLRELFETIVGRLYLVVITIGDENPYEIFESLNSTGLPLEESDLIRNFVFMQLPVDEQGHFHEQCWQPYEKLFDASGDWPAIPITPFCRDFLMRNGTFSRLRTTFVDFKQYFEETKQTPHSVVAELVRFAKFTLAILRGGQGYPKDVALTLSRFPLIDAATAHPLLLNLLDRFENESLDPCEFVDCVRDVESFVVRRTICGEQTGAYGRWFCEVIPLLADDPRDNLRRYLIHRGWPDDKTFQERLLEFPIYRRDTKKCRLLLDLIERSYGHKEMVDLQTLQIEHVMPQTIPAGKNGSAWRGMLGIGWKAVHDRWLHSIGNLTLTGYNPSLSNHPYEKKRDNLLSSNVSLNKWFEARVMWNEESIVERGKELAKLVSKQLPRPDGGEYKPLIQVKTTNAGRDRRKAFWTQLVELLVKRQSAWLPIRVTDTSVLDVTLPAYDAALDVKVVPAKHEIVVVLTFSRDRGRRMYAALESDRKLIEQDFQIQLQWINGEYPEIRATLNSASIRDALDWLEQQEWIADRLAEFHRAFHDRLKELHKITKEVKPHHQLLLDFWCGFHDELRLRNCEVRGVKPLPQVWNDFALGRSGCFLSLLCNTQEKRIAVHLVFSGEEAAYRFQHLAEVKAEVESEVGHPLEWHGPEGKKQKHVILRKNGVDPADPSTWPSQYSWLHEKLEQFYNIFRPRVLAFQVMSKSDQVIEVETLD